MLALLIEYTTLKFIKQPGFADISLAGQDHYTHSDAISFTAPESGKSPEFILAVEEGKPSMIFEVSLKVVKWRGHRVDVNNEIRKERAEANITKKLKPEKYFGRSVARYRSISTPLPIAPATVTPPATLHPRTTLQPAIGS
ncbi:MAG: hypothetical protein JST22_15280 [Bacteroidetes bacterium]|nr:hypothetical protein [Bacteroidota bacterium]